MKTAVTVCSITLVIMILLLASFFPFNVNQAKAQSLTNCPIGYQRNILGNCEPVSNLQTCPIGYQRSASGLCVPVVSSQTCPVGYQQIPPGICVPVTSSEFVNPYGYPTTAVNPQTTLTQPQATFNQPSSPTASLVSPTLTNPPAGQMSPWFPSLPAIACGGTSTMTTIGSIERDSNSDNNNNNGRNKMMTMTMMITKIMLFRLSQMEAHLQIPSQLTERSLLVKEILNGTMAKTLT